MKPKKIGVIYGGVSSERKISLKTGAAIADALRKEKFSVTLIDSGKKYFVKKLLASKIDFAFIALHGPFGEDGTMQGFLEILGFPYSGSGVLASSLAMDKVYTKRIFDSTGIPTPKWQAVNSVQSPTRNLQFPVVVKPARQGSAIGVTVVKEKSKLKKAIQDALKYDNQAIIEDYIKGTEISVPILGDEVLPPIEIIPKNEFYDFYSKYADGGSRHLIPPRLAQKIIDKAKQLGLSAHKSLGCRVMSRVDMIVDKRSDIYVLEVNTIPGMTATSLFPDSAKSAGYTFGALLNRIIKLSVNPSTHIVKQDFKGRGK